MFEHRSQALISRAQFLRRVAKHAAIATGVIAGSLLIGVLGYRLDLGEHGGEKARADRTER